MLSEELEAGEHFWKQKANLKWLKEGDYNAEFIHRTVKARRHRLRLTRNKDGHENWLTSIEDISKEGVKKFQERVTGMHVSTDEVLLDFISTLITNEQTETLIVFPTLGRFTPLFEA